MHLLCGCFVLSAAHPSLPSPSELSALCDFFHHQRHISVCLMISECLKLHDASIKATPAVLLLRGLQRAWSGEAQARERSLEEVHLRLRCTFKGSSRFIWDMFVLLQEATMCSFSSISSNFRQEKPLQLYSTETSEPSQRAFADPSKHSRADVSTHQTAALWTFCPSDYNNSSTANNNS